ncbi:MAG: hypothetical protein U0271_33705 [Polyangiaceae bacterium]
MQTGTSSAGAAGSDAPRVLQGRYQLLRPLREGSRARTWLAIDLTDRREVALERWLVRSEAASDQAAERARAASHPNLPSVREVFIEHDAASEHHVCVVRELVEGATLEEWLAERGGQPATEGEARVIAEQVLEALAHLHAVSPPLLHGAVSPKHVLRDPLGKVTLVGHDPRRAGDEPQGSARGLGFIAPEVATGVATPASDLFALGATLAFALTGLPLDRLPHKRLRVVLPASLGLSPLFAAWLAGCSNPRRRIASSAADAFARGSAPRAVPRDPRLDRAARASR